MARKPTAFDPAALECLKEFVKRKVNLSCNSFSQIQQLEENIRISTGEFLSLQTLNRLFGIIPNGFNPSLNTLDTLARYTGFKSFSDIETIAEHRFSSRQENNEVFRTLSSLFPDEAPSPVHEPGIFHVMENLCSVVYKDLEFGKLMYPYMARLPLGRLYLFERLVFIDQLAGLYGDALPVFLLYASDREQTFFILNMFCYKYFLLKDKEQFSRYFKILSSYPQSEVMRFRTHIIDRYYAVLVLNEFLGNGTPAGGNPQIAMPELDYFSSHPEYHHHTKFILGEALLLTGQFEKANEVLNTPVLQLDYKGELDKMYYETSLSVYKLVAGFFCGQISSKKANAMCHRLLDGPLPILAADFLSLMLLSLLIQLEKKRKEKKIFRYKIEVLIKKTKFNSFTVFQKICSAVQVEN